MFSQLLDVGITIMLEKPISQSLRKATMVKIHSAASSLAANIRGFSYEQVYVCKSGW
jgi:hypothetical protein